MSNPNSKYIEHTVCFFGREINKYGIIVYFTNRNSRINTNWTGKKMTGLTG